MFSDDWDIVERWSELHHDDSAMRANNAVFPRAIHPELLLLRAFLLLDTRMNDDDDDNDDDSDGSRRPVQSPSLMGPNAERVQIIPVAAMAPYTIRSNSFARNGFRGKLTEKDAGTRGKGEEEDGSRKIKRSDKAKREP